MADQKRRGWIECCLILAATGLFAAYLCFAAPTIFQGCDYVLMWKPIWRFLADALRHGTIPVWNPYIGLGRPFLADAQNAVFYPPTYLILLGQQFGPFLLIWLHTALAVFGMRRLGGALGVGRAQSYFMALCFVGSGALTARWMTGQIPYCWALCYAPWLFYCATRTNEPWNLRRIAWHALFLAAQFLCGNPQVFWFCVIGQAAFIAGRALQLPVRKAARDAGRGLGQFAVALGWCVGLVAAELLPFAELVGQGNRNAPSPAFANFLKLDWDHFGSLIAPTGISTRQPFVNWEMNLFVGALVAVLGVVGLCRVREPNVRGLLAMLVIGFLIAMGNSTPAFTVFYHWLPGFASLRAHSRAGSLIVFALICGAGICLSRPHPRLREIWNRRLKIPWRYAFTGLVLLQTANLLWATQKIKATYTFEKIMHVSADFPDQDALVKRLNDAGLLQELQPPPRVCVPGPVVPVNNGMIYHYGNFDANFSLFLRRDWDYLHRMANVPPPELVNTGVSELIYKRGPFPYPDVALSAGYEPNGGGLAVVTNTSPRAFLVYAVEVTNYEAILSKLANGHDIHQSALLEKPLGSLRPNNERPATLAHIRRFELDSLLVDVEAKEDGLLVLAEAWYPGWRGEIDGKIYESVPVNAWMRGVPIPPGNHEVRVYFHQDHLRVGLAVSVASAGCLLAAILWPRRLERRTSS